MQGDNVNQSGRIFLVGLGPGSQDQLTARALQAIAASEVVVGYHRYLDLIRNLLISKEVVGTGMQEEMERAGRAIALAEKGRSVAVVSSGDAGIYGMAGLVYEMLQRRGWPEKLSIDVEVVPGVSALNAAAALLGAPISHDFAVISLSDLLTPWDIIAHRLDMVAAADFVIVLFNPASARRKQPIIEARRILLTHRAPVTPVGVVTNAYREGQSVTVTDLQHMLEIEITMLSILIVGNSNTFVLGDRMVTPRGYSGKYDLGGR